MRKIKKITASPFSSLRELVTVSAQTGEKRDACRFIQNGAVFRITYRELYDDCESLGAALTARGYGKAVIAAVGKNSYPYIVSYITALLSAGTLMPLDSELPHDMLSAQLADSAASLVFYDEAHEPVLRSHRAALPQVSLFVGFDRDEDDGEFLSYRKLVEEGRHLPRVAFDRLRTTPTDAKIHIPSPTSDAVSLTEEELVTQIYSEVTSARPKGVGLSVLPYHSSASHSELLTSIRSQCTLFIGDCTRSLVRSAKAVRPDYIYLTAGVGEGIHRIMQRALKSRKAEERFRRAVKLSKLFLCLRLDLRPLIFRSLHRPFGGRLRKLLFNEPPSPETAAFFRDIGMQPYFGQASVPEDD